MRYGGRVAREKDAEDTICGDDSGRRARRNANGQAPDATVALPSEPRDSRRIDAAITGAATRIEPA